MPWLSAKEVHLLEALRNGCSLPPRMVDQARGELKPGSVYTMLNRMEKKGYVVSTSRSQREYHPTGYGLRMLEAWETAAAMVAKAALLLEDLKRCG